MKKAADDKLHRVHIDFSFVPMGYVAAPETGKLYVDVGNAFCPGVLDHHHPDAPNACTATQVLSHADFVRAQISDHCLTIIPHQYPDLDAVTGAYFARLLAESIAIEMFHHEWAEYVCRVDQGFTRLDPQQPVTAYSLFMMRLSLLQPTLPDDACIASGMMLESGFDFLDIIFAWLSSGGSLEDTRSLASINAFRAEVDAIAVDLETYNADMQRADVYTCTLPGKAGYPAQKVPAIWIEMPRSTMFKAWARGDGFRAGNGHGFIFLAIRVAACRFILSVNPDSDVNLKGLGDLLEQAETEKRILLGKERRGACRPGYDSSDPWYDGRSPLHAYTIVDSPRAGTVLTESELRHLLEQFSARFG